LSEKLETAKSEIATLQTELKELKEERKRECASHEENALRLREQNLQIKALQEGDKRLGQKVEQLAANHTTLKANWEGAQKRTSEALTQLGKDVAANLVCNGVFVLKTLTGYRNKITNYCCYQRALGAR
jgi:DNA repair ATPase RecN